MHMAKVTEITAAEYAAVYAPAPAITISPETLDKHIMKADNIRNVFADLVNREVMRAIKRHVAAAAPQIEAAVDHAIHGTTN